MLRRLAAALVFATGAFLIALADAPFIRYASVGNFHACSVSQVVNLPRHLDVLILGSSRMRRGISPDMMKFASDGELGTVVSLAAPGRHIVRSAYIFDELLDSGRTIDTLILEADIDSIRRSRPQPWTWEPMPAGRATWLDIVTKSPRLIANDTVPDPRLMLRGMQVKLQQAILIVTSGVAERVLHDPYPHVGVSVCWTTGFDRTNPKRAMLHERARTLNYRRYQDPDTAFDDTFGRLRGDTTRVEFQMIERIRAQAREAGTRLIVVRPTGYYEPALSPRVIARLQRLIPEYHYPPEPMVRALNHTQIDGSHYGPEGRRLFSGWLTDIILAERNAPAPSNQSTPP